MAETHHLYLKTEMVFVTSSQTPHLLLEEANIAFAVKYLSCCLLPLYLNGLSRWRWGFPARAAVSGLHAAFTVKSRLPPPCDFALPASVITPLDSWK